MFQKLPFVTALFICAMCFGQPNEGEERKAKYQAAGIIKADAYLSKGKLHKALSQYATLKRMDSTSTIGHFSKHKVDSLEPIVRNTLLNKLQGFWKWKETGSNWGIGETASQGNKDKYLYVSGNRLSFYEVNKITNEETLVQSEELKFSEFTDVYPEFLEIEYSTGKIWKYDIKNNGQELHLKHTGDLTETSRNVIDCGNIEITYSRLE